MQQRGAPQRSCERRDLRGSAGVLCWDCRQKEEDLQSAATHLLLPHVGTPSPLTPRR